MSSRHPDFKQLEASRPDWREADFHFTKTVDPEWKLGSGANRLYHETIRKNEVSDPSTSKPTDTELTASASTSTVDQKQSKATQHTPSVPQHISIDPNGAERLAKQNYRLLISAITPRPVAFVSTRSRDGTVSNLAPYSFFNMVTYDPPLFALGFSSPMAETTMRDSLRLLLETGECVVNIISEGFIEAANACCVNAPLGVDEWTVSGLHAVHDCQTVKAPRVAESVFSVEAKLYRYEEVESRLTPGKKTSVWALVEGTHFWVREDAYDPDTSIVDFSVLQPVSRLGGISYGRTTEAYELPRLRFDSDVGGHEGFEKLSQAKGSS